jgi:hypothetical protein
LVIINIDETWLSRTDFRRRKWKLPGSTNSVENPIVNPRISMIVALSNMGDLYLSISQGNTNAETFKIFIIYLKKKLDADWPNWRSNTVLQLDGATYNICEQTKIELQVLGFRVIFSGPHSYDGAPCELLFSQLKNADLNPLKEKTGKK